jgi:acetyl esterase/lipase
MRFDRLAPRPSRGATIEREDRADFVVERIRAERASPRHILYFPGGAFATRTPRWHRGLVSRLCSHAQADGLLTLYRLSPEHPFPAALEDCVASYRSLLQDGVAPSDIVLGGDSAGGCLVLSTLMALRGRDVPLPAGAFMLSAVTDLTHHRNGSRTDNLANDPLVSRLRGWEPHELYVEGRAALLRDPLVSPVFGAFEGLPPLLFQVSTTELLLDDSVRAADAARAARVQCEIEAFDALPHVWQLLPWLPETDTALRSIGAFVRRCASP